MELLATWKNYYILLFDSFCLCPLNSTMVFINKIKGSKLSDSYILHYILWIPWIGAINNPKMIQIKLWVESIVYVWMVLHLRLCFLYQFMLEYFLIYALGITRKGIQSKNLSMFLEETNKHPYYKNQLFLMVQNNSLQLNLTQKHYVWLWRDIMSKIFSNLY